MSSAPDPELLREALIENGVQQEHPEDWLQFGNPC